MFCRVVRYPALANEVVASGKRSDTLRTLLDREDTRHNAALYLLLRAVDRFSATYNRFPGSFDR